MIYFEPTDDMELVKQILTEPRTYFKCNGITYKEGTYLYIPEYVYVCKFKKTILGLLMVDRFTNTCASVHAVMKPEYCNPTIIRKSTEAMLKVFSDMSSLNKLLVTVPVKARHVIRTLINTGFKKEGKITDSILYGDKLMDCELLTYNIKRN